MPRRFPGWTIVGVDCALQEERMGLARALLDEQGVLHLERVTLGTAGESASANICQWIEGAEHFVIALDAPLGWPLPLSVTLAQHSAGQRLEVSADELFRRETDRAVHKRTGKAPPDIGAGSVALIAHAALELLDAVRKRAARPVPLAFAQAQQSGVIEVFPAATLIARGANGSGYKPATPRGRSARRELLDRLSAELDVTVAREVMIEDANLFDAVVCVLAGADFARGLCEPPADLERARQEGFIWVRSSGQRSLFD